jgi:hypothetical protein
LAELKVVTVSIILGFMILLICACPSLVTAQPDSDGDGISDAEENVLAVTHLPYMQFKAGERFFPVAASYHIDNSILEFRSGETATAIDMNPTIDTISTKGEGYFLNNTLGNATQIAADYETKKASLGYTVYARVTRDAGSTIVQFWFFYAYNDAPLNDHQGDWEMIQIALDNDETPVSAEYSQHLKGQSAVWSDVEKVNTTHPVIYVARGSHANYFRPYQGKLGLESDDVGADGVALPPSDLTTVMLGEIAHGNHPASQDWLEFGGRWGDWAKLADAAVGFAGPYGPGQGDNFQKWHNPVSWGESISAVNGNWFMLSWIAANFLLIFIIVTVALSLWKVWRVVRLKRKGGLKLPAVLKNRRASIGIALGVVGIVLTVGGMFLPWYNVRANIQTTMISTQGEVDLLVMDGQRGVLVNLLVNNNGLAPVFGLQIPFGIVLLVGIIFGILDIIGLEKAKGLGNKYLRGGITFLILFMFLVLFISLLASMLNTLAATIGTTLPQEATEMAQAIAQQPFMGSQTKSMGDFGSVALSWGLGLGAYMLLAAAIVKLVASFVLRSSREQKPEPETKATPPPPPA